MITTASYNCNLFIREREAFRENAYEDGKYYAIGYGNMFWENGLRVQRGQTITRERAIRLSDFWIRKFANETRALVTSNVTQNQFDALVSYVYNRGANNFAKTKLLKMVNEDPNNADIKKQFVIEWGSTIIAKKGLINRREKEAILYFTGVTPTVKKSSSTGTSVLFFLVILGIIIYVYSQKKPEKKPEKVLT